MSYYFDHAATGLPRAQRAIAAATAVINGGSAQRGYHHAAITAHQIIEEAREAIAPLVGTTCQTHSVCFLPSTTAALNQVILGLRPRPSRIALDPLAHHATYRPIIALAQQQQIPHWILPHNAQGLIDCAQLTQAWQPETDLVVLTHASNVTGLVQPVTAVMNVAKRFGAKVVIDAAQSVGVIDTQALGIADAVAFGGHKGLSALPGLGVLVINSHTIKLEPIIYGGTGRESASDTMPDRLPQQLEAGTPNLPAIAAIAAQAKAAKKAAKFSKPVVSAHALREAVLAGGGQVLSTGEASVVPVVSFALPDIPHLEAADMLERCFDIQLRSGLHCAPLAHRTLGTFPHGTLRVSTGETTTLSDLEHLTQALRGLSQSYLQIHHHA
ncbi:MAG: aminotransferase class V-fold PLP-dependent enzyme [Cyanobacteria bacterium P01_D01_bin.105]